MNYTIRFIRPTQTQLCLPELSKPILVLYRNSGRIWAQRDTHGGSFSLSSCSLLITEIANATLLRACLLKIVKLLLTAAVSYCLLL